MNARTEVDGMKRSGTIACGLLLVACVWLGIGASGCRKGSDELFDPVPKHVETKEVEPDAKAYDVPEEPYDERGPGRPRIQVMWDPPEHERGELWSFTLDGSDFRPVAQEELLYGGELKYITQRPQRSPDGRYVALSGTTDDERIVRVLLDRKTRTVKTIKRSGGFIPEFNWTPDSRHLLYYDGGDLWDYAVDTGETTKPPMVYGSRLLLLPDGKRFLSVGKKAIEWRSRDGKLLKRVALPFEEAAVEAISPTGRRIAFYGSLSTGEEGVFVVETERPATRVYESKEAYFAATFGGDDSTLFFFRPDGFVRRLDLATKKVVELFKVPCSGFSEMTYVSR